MMEKLLPFERSYWIIPGKLLAGEYPAASDTIESNKKLEGLIQVGIKTVINLTEENEHNQNGIKLFDYTDYLTHAGIEVHRKPIKDISVPAKGEMYDIIELIDNSLKADKPVCFHCWGGVGRTGTVLGCYLLHTKMANKLNVFETINYLKRTTSISHRQSPETEEQRKFVLNYRQKGEKLPVEYYTGCLLGGAIGDALGAPIEFLSYDQIKSKYGKNGITDYVEYSDGTGEFTDDTQMTLFTAEGLLRAYHRYVLKGIDGAQTKITYNSYLRWLQTQGITIPKAIDSYGFDEGWLIKRRELFVKRAPGNTCISALQSGKSGTIELPINDSKGCGTVMRVAPVGLIYKHDSKFAFREAVYISALTHGHPSGYLSGGFLASVIADLASGLDLQAAIKNAENILVTWDNHIEVLNAIQLALEIHTEFKGKELTYMEIEKLGSGWIAEEALSISILCALHYQSDFEKGVLCAVNHSGDSDSTGSITGNILGLILGIENIPHKWVEKLLYCDIVEEIGSDLFIGCKSWSYDTDAEWHAKYPAY
jgi:ADP-ribosylglycohydrolase/protein-tyrosine phosphatase